MVVIIMLYIMIVIEHGTMMRIMMIVLLMIVIICTVMIALISRMKRWQYRVLSLEKNTCFFWWFWHGTVILWCFFCCLFRLFASVINDENVDRPTRDEILDTCVNYLEGLGAWVFWEGHCAPGFVHVWGVVYYVIIFVYIPNL